MAVHLSWMILILVLARIFWGWAFKQPDSGPKEPPMVSSKVPIIGHVLGFQKYGLRYLEVLRLRCRYPVFSLRILINKSYVITSAPLAKAALNSNALSPDPLVAKTGPKLLGLSDELAKVMAQDVTLERDTLLATGHKLRTKYLAPSESLWGTGTVLLDGLSTLINAVGNDWQSLDFHRWLSDGLVLATSTAIYGVGNPLKQDPSLIEDMWTFEENQMKILLGELLLGPFSKFFAAKALRARSRLGLAFEKYYRENQQHHGSDLVKNMYAAARDIGTSISDCARLEIFLLTVATVNAVPTLFWMITQIIADQDLLDALRSELSNAGIVVETPVDPLSHFKEMTIRASLLKRETCPLLLSTYFEALRTSNQNVSNREVLTDTLLSAPGSSEAYKLSKGTRVIIPAVTLHGNPAIWGSDAQSFNAARFLDREHRDKSEKKLLDQAYFPFGGGRHLCPGRHLAELEILAMASVLILAVDVSGETIGEIPNVPEAAYHGAAKKPVNPGKVHVRRRSGLENTGWRFELEAPTSAG